MANWKNKLLAFLHDPPSKALDLATHGQQSRAAMLRAGFTDEEVSGYNRPADHTAAAADRLPFPASRASGLACAFDGLRNPFRHPLTGRPLAFHAEFPSAELAIEGEGSVQPAIEDYGDLQNDLDIPTGLRWRARFLAHWRLWPKHAAERDYRLALLPADTRIPDHTIWNHMQIVSALAGCAETNGDDNRLKPAFLKFQLGPVQDFIAQARSTRDLWSGSYLLSWLTAAGLKALSAEIGPDAVIFPSLRGQPLFDLHWRDDLWNKVRMEKGANTIWESLAHDKRDLLTPNLPNVFLAVVPAARSAELGRLVEAAVRDEWQRIADAVWGFCDSAIVDSEKQINLTADEGALTRTLRLERFKGQVRRFLSLSWQATPWPQTLEQALALSEGFVQDMPIVEARERVQAVVDMATKHMPLEHRDRRYYTDATRTELNNVGLSWSVILAANSWALDAVRQTRAFDAWAEGGWSSGTVNSKDALNGRDEAVAGGREWQRRCEKLGGVWQSLFKRPEWVGGLTLIKRVWHLAYLRDVWRLRTDPRDFPMPSTRSIAAHKPEADDAELDPETGSEDRHFAVLALDGDEIGKWVSGQKTPVFATQVADYRDGSGVVRHGSRAYFERPEFGEFLDKQRPLSPSHHLQFSEALSNFALRCARPVVEVFDGRLIYAGGDDVLALVPADAALACARALRSAFRGEAGLSEMLKEAALKAPEAERRYFHRLALERFLLNSPHPGFVHSGDVKADYAGRLIPFIVPGDRAEVSLGIAIAHFKAPLQDVVRAAQAAEKRAKRDPSKGGLGRGAVAVSLFKRSGEIIEWGCKWESGGLALFDALLRRLRDEDLSAKFPHRVVELLEPYLLKQSGLTQMQPAPLFDLLEVVRRDLGHAVDRQCTRGREEKKEIAVSLDNAVSGYLNSLPEDRDSRVRAVIGLCQTLAFAYRTLPETPEP